MAVSRIARFEWRLLSADRSLRWLSVVFALVVAYGIFNGVSWVRFQRETIDSVVLEEAQRHHDARTQIARITSGDSAGLKAWLDPRIPSNAGGTIATRYAVLPPAPLAALAIGQSDLYPYYARISTRIKQSFIVNDEIENPTNLLSGRFDLAFAVIYLFPLLILAMTYNLISAEREQGTLAMILSQPVRVRRVMTTKILVRAGIVLALAIVLTCAAAIAAGVGVTAPGVGARLGLWCAIVVLYGAFWFAVALGVNTLGRSSATNAIILLGVWLGVVVLIPSLYNVIVTTAHPTPSRVELTTALRKATTDATERGSVVLQKYYLDHPEMMGGVPDMDNFAARAVAVQEDVEKIMGPTLAAFDQRIAEQQTLADRYRFVSPAIVTQAALYDAAGTGVYRYRHFQTLVDGYHARWQQFFFPRVFARQALRAADYDALPAWSYQEESIGGVAQRTANGLLWLLIPTIVAISWSARGLRRLDLAER